MTNISKLLDIGLSLLILMVKYKVMKLLRLGVLGKGLVLVKVLNSLVSINKFGDSSDNH